jgi:macrolide transport system ATP-binding/permease protein
MHARSNLQTMATGSKPAADSSAQSAFLELSAIRREFTTGDQVLTVLKDVNLTIAAGEMVAIVGASGSGKSTLMNILGCLDRPSGGAYRIAGTDTRSLAPDELAQLRREYFGFVFQRYHLLADLNAIGNVETPAIYAGTELGKRRRRSVALLKLLGLGDRMHHRPSQLSGGQQQRVSIARALMNGGKVILADEPTGALDRQSGEDVMRILQDLNAAGHTIIIVTHDMNVAQHARRIVQISDGEIISDTAQLPIMAGATQGPGPSTQEPGRAEPGEETSARLLEPVDYPQRQSPWGSLAARFVEALRMAVIAMNAHRLRAFLTMLGIVIGIAAVISVVALGNGSRQRILADISAIGTNTIEIFPGSGFGDQRSSKVQTLLPADAAALAEQDYIDSVTPTVSTSVTLRYGAVAVTGLVSGVGEAFFQVRGLTIDSGRAFNTRGIDQSVQEAVIDPNTRAQLFPDGRDPVGATILVGSVPFRIVGITAVRQTGFGNDENLNVYIPYTAAMNRLIGQSYLKNITVRISNNISDTAAQAGIERLLMLRHGRKDFFLFNASSLRQTIESTTATMTLLISMIAVISLIVGGIGVMNIMLVSVTERTREIGVRMAVGARRGDILQQFLIEAILICLVGGVLGVVTALLIGAAFAHLSSGFSMIFSTASIVFAFLSATLIGLVFGFLPARSAAHLDPVDALSRE